MVESVSQCFSFLRISLLNSFYNFWRVSRPASEKDLRYWKKALNLTSSERRLNISKRFPYMGYRIEYMRIITAEMPVHTPKKYNLWLEAVK